MSIVSNQEKVQANLSKEEKQKLASLLAELKARGISVPDELKATRVKWPKDSRGYTVKADGTFFQPYDELEKFVSSKARFNLLYGSRGCGKTTGGGQKALAKIEKGLPGIVANPDFENFKISTWPEFREWIPWGTVVPAHRYRRAKTWTPHQPFQLNFLTGAWVICKGIKDEDSARGPNVNWFWYDEGQRDATGGPWRIAEASVRIRMHGESPQSWVTATPRGKYHWMHEFYIEKNIPDEVFSLFSETVGGEDIPLLNYYYGTIFDNKDNLDPGFFASMLAAYPEGYLRDQEIYGRFVEEGGILGDSSWFKEHVLETRPPDIYKKIRFWDLAATERKMSGKKNDPDETVGTLLSLFENKKDFCIEDQIGGYWEWDSIKENIKKTAMYDGVSVRVYVEEEPGSGGKNQVAELNSYLKKELPGHPGVIGYRPEGDRVMLANIWFAEASNKRFYIVQGDWNREFFKQLDGFPEAVHDDRVTSVSGARINIAPIRKWSSIQFLSL